jgi:hypothetical protein
MNPVSEPPQIIEVKKLELVAAKPKDPKIKMPPKRDMVEACCICVDEFDIPPEEGK